MLRTFVAALLVTAALVVATVLLAGSPAVAACHAFGIEVTPTTVREGGHVTVTVSRDAAVSPSQVDVSTVDGSATAGEDYRRLEQTASFTDEIQQTFTIDITDDDLDEPAETFRVRLSNPGGCAPNPNFVVDPDVRVTIRASDAAAPSPTPTETETETEEPTPSPEPSPTPQPSPSPTESPLAAPEDTGGGLSGAAIAGIVAGAAVVIGAVAIALLRRLRAGPAS